MNSFSNALTNGVAKVLAEAIL